MKMKKRNVVVLTLLWLGLTGFSVAGATVIYQENFDGAATDLDKTPTTVSGTYGTSGASWTAPTGGVFLNDGTVSTSLTTPGSSGGNSAYLPFDPIVGSAGNIYRLEVVMSVTGDTSSNWLSLGFANSSNTSEGPNASIPNGGLAWMLARGSDAVVGFGGMGTANNSGISTPSGFDSATSNTYAIELDMTAQTVSGGTTEVTYFVNGSSVGSDSLNYSGTNEINFIQLGKVSTQAGSFDSLTLTVIPEPSALLMVGLGLGALILFRRHS
jgi:hypothetical protein